LTAIFVDPSGGSWVNPVRRGLVGRAIDWKWFSAGWYDSDKSLHDPELPTIHGLPWDFFL